MSVEEFKICRRSLLAGISCSFVFFFFFFFYFSVICLLTLSYVPTEFEQMATLCVCLYATDGGR